MTPASSPGNRLRSAGCVLALLIATTRDASAYVDPGTGAMILQIIAAVVTGALFYFRALRDRISSWYSRLTSRPTAPKDENG